MPPKFTAKFTFDEYNLRVRDAIDARRAWVDTIADHPTDHYLISCKWTVFVDLVRFTRTDMAEFERNLRLFNPTEFEYTQRVAI